MNSFKLKFIILILLYCNSSLLADEKKAEPKEKTKNLRWLSKSDQFVIYQDRKITKSKNKYITVSVGKHHLNGISHNNDLNVRYSYYNTEKIGFGAYFNYSLSSIDESIEIREDSAYVFYNESNYQVGGFLDWVPLYGKHLYGRKVVYTDAGMSFLLGYATSKNNNKAVENLDETQALESVSSIDAGLVFFTRVFFEEKYFLKIGYILRNTQVQEANKPGEASAGTGRTFANSLLIGFGYKL